jgi:hypothetical protein
MLKKIYDNIHLNLKESEVTKLNLSDLTLAKEFIKNIQDI